MPAQINGVTARKPRSSKRIEKNQPAQTLPGAKPVAGKGRQPNGTFAPGNNFGPGNPHARHCVRMLALFRSCVSDQDMIAIIRALVDKAALGDTSAAKILFSYTIGKPETAPNPDQIDRDEWEHYQKDTINLEQMQQVLGSLPAKLGNDIARTALPIMNEVRTKALAAQLREGCVIPQESIEPAVDAHETPAETPPLSNGVSCDDRSTNANSRSTHHAPRSTSPTRPTTIDDRSTTPPLSNGSTSESNTNNLKRKASKPQWLQPLARRLEKSGRKKRSTARKSK